MPGLGPARNPFPILTIGHGHITVGVVEEEVVTDGAADDGAVDRAVDDGDAVDRAVGDGAVVDGVADDGVVTDGAVTRGAVAAGRVVGAHRIDEAHRQVVQHIADEALLVDGGDIPHLSADEQRQLDGDQVALVGEPSAGVEADAQQLAADVLVGAPLGVVAPFEEGDGGAHRRPLALGLGGGEQGREPERQPALATARRRVIVHL